MTRQQESGISKSRKVTGNEKPSNARDANSNRQPNKTASLVKSKTELLDLFAEIIAYDVISKQKNKENEV